MADQIQSKPEKKRTTYKMGKITDFPEHILDRSKYGYRWINNDKYSEASDGYEPRGWEVFKDKDGKHVKRGDLVLAQMPKDMHDAMLEEKKKARDAQTKLFLDQEAAQMEELAHEFRKKGGKVKFEFTQE